MKKSKFLLLTTLSPIISLPFLSASCIAEAKADNKMEKDIKINENKDEKNSSETMNDKQKQDKSSIDSKMEEKTDKDSSKSEEGKSMKNEHTDEKNSSETMNDKQKQDSGTNSDQKDQDSKTDGSSNEPTRPSENAQNDMPIENSEISTYLDKVNEYGKETSEFANLLITLKEVEEANELLKKHAKILPIVKKLFELYERLIYSYEETKKEIEKVIGDPGSKNKLLDILLKQYEESRVEIKAVIEKLKDLKKKM